MTAARKHNVQIRVGSKVIEKWTEYTITSDMLTPADSFRIGMANAPRAVYDLCVPDTPCQVLVDDAVIITGFIDDRRRRVKRGDGSVVEISGRDKGGRLVDESMDLRSLNGLTVQQFAEVVASPWFGTITGNNDANRARLRGPLARAIRVGKEAIDPDSRGASRKKVHPGESRWQVLRQILEEVGLISWSSADGTALVIGQPNYEQEIAYRFMLPMAGSKRAAEGNVIELELDDTVAERYSMVTAVGSGHGSASDYGDDIVAYQSSVKNGPGKFGEGADFKQRKTLIVSHDDVRSQELAAARAKREMAERDGTGKHVTIHVAGHSQLRQGRPALYAFDCLAQLEDEELGLRGTYSITGIDLSLNRDESEMTTLRMVPKGTVLRV